MRTLVSLIPSLFSYVVALQYRETVDNQKCYSGKKVYFVHVMKDGGSSVDYWFNCLGRWLNFGVKHAEGLVTKTTGSRSCPSAVCCAHHSYAERVEVCGAEFADATSFTILREPVSRIYSLYTYYKYEKQIPYLTGKTGDGSEKSFEWFLSTIQNSTTNKIDGFESNPFEDGMTVKYFQPNALTISLARRLEEANMLELNYVATRADLRRAKAELLKLDAVFFSEHLDKFQWSYGRSRLPFSENVTNFWKCAVPHANPANCGSCATSPSEQEVAMAQALNSMDIELYNYALTLYGWTFAVPSA